MSDHNPSSEDPFGPIVDEFVDALRQGKRPSVEEFARRYPEYADTIREMLPALVLMEKAKSDDAASTHHPAAVSTPAGLLQQLGDYQILREVGRGGMGVVYEAQQLSLGRHVALKVLTSHALLDPRQLARFEREARAAAKLHHTNIVPVFGVGEQNGVHYYVMQLIQGLGLDQVLVELQRLQQPGGQLPLTQDVLPRQPTNRPRDVAAVAIAHALVSGEFRSPAPASPLTTAEGEPAAGADLETPTPARAADSSATILLPGQTEGATLTGSGRQYWQSIARIGVQVADALTYAAHQGVLHRDIKPSNLLLDEQGNVWVTDFGLAKADSDADNLTHTGDIIGTLRYMAPERFDGQGDLRTDVYSLGLTLYELLTLRPAFDESDRNKLVRRVMHDEPVRPRKLNRAVPPDLETVVLKAIARDPAHRYQTPSELSEDLKRFVEDRPIRARRVSEAEKFRRWCRRNPLPASLLAGIVLVFLAGFAGVFWQWRLAEAETERAEVALYNSYIARAQFEYRANNIAGANEILERCPPERRNWEWHFLEGLNHADLLTLTGHTSWVYAVAYSPNGKLIASAGGGNPFWRTYGSDSVRPGEVILWDAATGKRVYTRVGHEHVIEDIAFSPDGKLLASASLDKTAKLWDVASGKEVRTLKTPSGLTSVAFSPDGSLLATGDADGVIHLWEVDSRKERRTLRGHTTYVRSLAFSRDGKRLASNSHSNYADSEAHVWDLASGRQLPLDSNGTRGGGMALSPEARYLAASADSDIKVWDLTTGKLIRKLTGHLGQVHGLAFSPDGLTIASCGEDSTVRVWDLMTGVDVNLFRGHTGRANAVMYSPDGTRLVSGGSDGTVKVWDATLHPEYASLRAGRSFQMGNVEALAFGADGRSLTLVKQRSNRILRIHTTDHTVLHLGSVDLTEQWLPLGEPACLDPEGRWLTGVTVEAANIVKCWDSQTGKERVVLRGHSVPVWHVTVSPGGRRLATGSAGYPIQLDPDQLGEVKVWDGDTGKPLFEMAEKGLGITRLALSPTGDRLAVAGYRIVLGNPPDQPKLVPFITVYAVPSGRELQSIRDGEDLWCGLAFSSDGARLAACGYLNKMVLLWDLDTGKQILTRTGPNEGGDVAFSPDGRRLAVGGRRLQKLLDAATGEELLVLRGEAQRVRGTNAYNPRVRWSPDGKELAAYCGDSVSVWSGVEDNPEEKAARRRAAERRAQVYHVTMAEEFATKKPDVTRFHLDQVRNVKLGSAWEYAFRGMAYAQLGQQGRADADYARASRLAPDNPLIEFFFGEAYAAAGLWDQAAPFFDRYFAQGRGSWASFSQIAGLPLYRHDRATYRQYAQLLLERYSQSRAPAIVSYVLLWGLLVGENDADPRLLVRLADRCLESSDKQPPNYVLVEVKGMAEYRAGRMKAAVEWLRKAELISEYSHHTAAILFFLSMAYQRLYRGDKAKAAYQKALGHLEKEFGSRDKYQPGKGVWYAWVWCQVLRREAEAVLKNAKGPDKPKD